jgi:hypothetical protein
MKSLLDWHLLYDSLLNITLHLIPLVSLTHTFFEMLLIIHIYIAD